MKLKNTSEEQLNIDDQPTQKKTLLHRQLFSRLRLEILDGTLAAGTKLPSESELCKTYGMSRITVRRALDELVSARLIERGQGRRTEVLPFDIHAPLAVPAESLRMNDLAIARATRVQLLKFTYLPAGPEIAGIMGIEVGEEVQFSIRLRVADVGPISHNTTYVPAWLGRNWTSSDMVANSMLDLLDAQDINIERAIQTLGAKSADATVAQALGVAPGTPLLSNARRVFDDQGRVIEFVDALIRPDLYKFSFISEY